MAKPVHDDVRKLFTEIGCIMEDASLIAIVWSSTDNLDVRARFREISDAREKIGQLPAAVLLCKLHCGWQCRIRRNADYGDNGQNVPDQSPTTPPTNAKGKLV